MIKCQIWLCLISLLFISGCSTCCNTYGGNDGDRRGHGLLTPYDLTLRHFDTREALSIIGVMADEFPGYKEHNLIRKLPVLRKYRYITSAKPHKIEEWLSILLMNMGFDVDRQVEIDVKGSEIRVEKIVTTPNRPRSGRKNPRFN